MTEKLQTPDVTSSQLEETRVERETGGVYDEIADVLAREIERLAEKAIATVTTDEGTFYKLPSGDWKGGLYGTIPPYSPMAEQLETAFSQQQVEQVE